MPAGKGNKRGRVVLSLLFAFVSFAFAQEYTDSDYYRAEQKFLNGAYPEALHIIDSISPENPYYQNGLLLKGHIYLHVDSLENAEQAFNAILDVNSQSELAYNGLGLVYYNRIANRKTVVKFFRRLFVTPEAQKSEDMFKKALEINEAYTDARYNLARLYLKTGDETDKITAENILGGLTDNYPSNALYTYALGEIKLQLGKYDEAAAIYGRMAAQDQGNGNIYVQLAYVFWHKKQYDLFSRYYLTGLSFPLSREIILKLTRDCWDILTIAEQNMTEKGTLPPDFLLKMWRSKDPNPMTETNERLIIHYKRLEIARDLYRADTYTGYDDRGAIYVKYGEPDNRYSDAFPKFDVKANESWSYTFGDAVASYDFVQEGANYTLVDDLTEAMNMTSLGKIGLNVLVDMYQNRSHLDGYYQRVSNDLLAIDPSAAENVSSLSSISPAISRYKVDRIKTRTSLPVSTYNFEMEGSDLPFYFDYAWFYEQSDQVRLELYFGLSRAALQSDGSSSGDLPVIDQSILIQSRDYETLVRGSNKIDLNKAAKRTGDYLFQTDVIITDFDPVCNVQLENKAKNQKRLVQLPLSIPFFRDTSFSVSDIQVSIDIHARTEMDGAMFTKKDLYILPYPYKVIRSSHPVYFYFEIYNMNRDKSGMAEYEIQLKLFRNENRRNLVNLIQRINPFRPDEKTSITTNIRRRSDQSLIPEYIALDMSALSPGTYELIVSVISTASGDIVNRKHTFELVN